MDWISYAQEVIRHEASMVAALADRLGESFNQAVTAILDCKGRVIVTGLGKSGLIGRKIAATFNSTGISSFFLHPSEALHGDLGLIRSEDILMVISKSGQISEIEEIMVAARRMGVPIIGLCGTVDSLLYQRADIAIDCSVSSEACPNNLVPTSSSTAALVMGDALALALLKSRDFGKEDFAQLHPGGFLGRRLLKHVSEYHHSGEDVPLIQPDATVSEMMMVMSSKRLGCVLMKDPAGKVGGIFCDGDLRRLAEKVGERELFRLKAGDVMIRNPKTISQDAILDSALAIMERNGITQLPTVDKNGQLVGVIHIHDILRSKLV